VARHSNSQSMQTRAIHVEREKKKEGKSGGRGKEMELLKSAKELKSLKGKDPARVHYRRKQNTAEIKGKTRSY